MIYLSLHFLAQVIERTCMKKTILSMSIIALLLFATLYAASGSIPGVSAMEKIDTSYPNNIIDFDDFSNTDDFHDRANQYIMAEERSFIPATKESLNLTEERVQAFDCTTAIGVSENECQALVALYAATNGSAWKINFGWLETPDVAEWYGVAIKYGGVGGLTLHGNNLVGYIPAEIGNLTNMMLLSLYDNQLTGEIPQTIENVKNLRYLWLQNNFLTGEFPSAVFKLQILRELDLGANLLYGSIPDNFSNMQSLDTLHLYMNKFTGTIPQSLSAITELSSIDLSYNNLHGNLPQWAHKLYQLEKLSLGHNYFTGNIPGSIMANSRIIYLDLEHNNLSGELPADLSQMIHLKILNLGENLFFGDIPIEYAALINLQYLNLSNNKITGEIPQWLNQLTKLHSLFLNGNQLTGTIPIQVFRPYYLKRLHLNNNQLVGTLPRQLEDFTRVVELDISNNQLNGLLPINIGNLRDLYHLNISNNKFSGVIPDSLRNLNYLCPEGAEYSPCFGKYKTDLGYNQFNVPQSERMERFLEEKDPDWHLTQAIQATVPCDSGGEIISRDGRIEVVIPAEACDGELDVLLAPFSKPSYAYLPMFWANNGFELTAWNEQGAVTQFHKPLGFTLYYADGEIGPLPEEQLAVEMYMEDYRVWSDAINTCPGGEYTRNVDENWVRLPVCHLTEFGLFNIPEMPFRLYIPIANK